MSSMTTSSSSSSSSSSSCCEIYLDYRAALHLNNVAVSLMERGCYSEAASTMKDACRVMKSYSSRRSNIGASWLSASEIGRKVQRACSQFTKKPTKKNLNQQHRRLETVQYEDNLIPHLCLESDLLVGCLRPTRIELPDFTSAYETCLSERDTGLDLCCILCNLGLACHLLSTAKNGADAESLQGIAYSTFSAAIKNVTARFASCQNDIEEAGVMSVALLVTGNLSQVHMETGRTNDAIVLYEKCHSVREAMQNSEAAEWISLMHSTYATLVAAAA